MVRDLFESIPVALLLAAILSYGIRHGQDAQPRIAPQTIFSPVSHMAEGDPLKAMVNWQSALIKKHQPVVVEDSVPVADTETTVRESIPNYFISDHAPDPALPSITTRDFLRAAATETDPAHHAAAIWERSAGTGNKAAANDGKPVINRAETGDLERIPGIGPKKARLIIDRRPQGGFADWDELDNVPGIGAGTIQAMQLHATLN